MTIQKEFRETGQILKVNMGNIFLFETAYRLLTLPLLFQAVNALVRLSLRWSGYSYVTVNNLKAYLMKPGTVLAILAIAFAVMVQLMIEIGGLMTAFEAAGYSRKVNVLTMALGGLDRTVQEIRRKNWKLFLVLSIHYLLTNAFLCYRLLCRIKPLKFILPGLLHESWGRLLIVVFAMCCILVSIPTAFMAFGCMLEQKGFRDSLERSRELLKGRRVQNCAVLVACNAAVIAVWGLLYLFGILLVAVFAVWFIDRRMELAVLLAARDKIEYAIIFLGSIASMVVNYGALTVLYVRYSKRLSGQPSGGFVLREGAGKRSMLNRRNVLGLLAVVTAVSMAAVYDVSVNGAALAEDLFSEIQITAHRGASRMAPENTLPALQSAMDEMADYAEIDVQETRDGHLVLFHDSTLKRIMKTNRTVKSMSLKELQTLDAGKWFSEEFEGTKIPTLEEAMDLCKGKMKLNIEIKYMGAASEIPEKTAELIEELGWQEQCVVTSTSYEYLRRVKAVNPDIYTGYIVSAAYGSYYTDEAMDFISILSSSASLRLIDAAHEAGKEVHVWTVNSKSELERMKLSGVDNIITDYPLLAREVFYSEKNTEGLLARLQALLK